MAALKFAARPATVVLLGDSITQQGFDAGGWGARLSNYFVRRADVVNRGFSGYNTAWVLEVLDGMFARFEDTALVTVFLGANDAALAGGRQHIPVEVYAANLSKIVASIREQLGAHASNAGCEILLLTPPPIDDAREQHRTNEHTAQYAAAAVAAAGRLGVPVVNLHAKMSAEPEWRQRYLSDGVHLTPEGNGFVFQCIETALHAHFPHLTVVEKASELPMHKPCHKTYGLGC